MLNKPISNVSFAKTTPDDAETDADESLCPQTGRQSSTALFASATETTLRGPALGPELFVEAVAKAYTTWLEEHIVNGPVGHCLLEREAQKTSGTSRRKPPPGKMLIASALPPLIEDDVLWRIPEKYVNGKEEDLAKQQRRVERSREGSVTGSVAMSREGSLEEGLSTLRMTDEKKDSRPSTPISTSTESSRVSSVFDSILDSSLHTTMTTASSPSSSTAKISIDSLLQHDPPLCTLPVRIKMTNHYNSLISAFCTKHPLIFGFVDITDPILNGNPEGTPTYAADRTTWACPVDPTNIHPLWEPTLPLWLEELKKEGLKTETWKINADAEETFKQYEEDKKRRVAGAPDWESLRLRDE